MRTALALVALFVLPSVAAAVSVNGVTIPQSRIDEATRAAISQGATDSQALRQQVITSLVQSELILQEAARRGLDKGEAFERQLNAMRNQLLVQEALRRGLDKSESFQKDMAAMRQQVLGQTMLETWAKAAPVSDKEIQAEYDRMKPSLGGNEYQVRHILVATEADALAVIAALDKGSKFDDMARTKSLDKQSGKDGGQMGWVRVSLIPPVIADAIKSLGKGQYSRKPIQGPSGWHVFKVDDTRVARVPPLAELKDDIVRQLKNRKIGVMVDQLKAKAKIQP